MYELIRALAVLLEPPGESTGRLVELLGLSRAPEPWEHRELFEEQLYPYGAVYLGAEGMLGGEAADRVAGFWRALGETPPPEPDHLSVLLGLYAHLAELEQGESGAGAAAWRRARTALLWEHMLSWVPVWLDALERVAPGPYRRWGLLVARVLEAEATELDLPDELPRHLEAAAALPAPASVGGDAFLAALLAPARTGIILTRTDLVDLAAGRGLSLRIGERRYVLRSLLSQDPRAVLESLARLACEGSERGRGPAGPIRTFWAARAAAAARTLQAAATEASDLLAPPAGPSIP